MHDLPVIGGLVQYSRRHVSINRDASWRAVERGKD